MAEHHPKHPGSLTDAWSWMGPSLEGRESLPRQQGGSPSGTDLLPVGRRLQQAGFLGLPHLLILLPLPPTSQCSPGEEVRGLE